MTRNARTEAKRPTLCHAGERAAGAPVRAGAAAGAASKTTGPSKPTPADNFCARVRSNRESRAAAGARFEAHALAFLQRQRLVLVARNVHCRGGELDLVMRERDGTLVFVEVRARTRRGYGGAAASVGWHKRQRVLRAARCFLAARAGGDPDAFAAPACRFDVVAFEAGRLEWLRDAFREDES